jgi:hypothetical protein
VYRSKEQIAFNIFNYIKIKTAEKINGWILNEIMNGQEFWRLQFSKFVPKIHGS